MALFDTGKKTASIVKKVRPTVVKTDDVAKEIASIAKKYDVKPEALDFNLLDVRTYTRFVQSGVETEWKEVKNETLRDIDRSTLLNPDFQIKQVYEVEVFSRLRNKESLEEFKIAIGANATKCKVYMQIQPGSILKYFSALKEELRIYINKHKIRAGIYIYIFDEMLEGVISKLSAKAQVEEIIIYETSETILIAESIEPTQTNNGTLVMHYENRKQKEDENTRVDHSNREFIQSIHKDELLIEYIKPRSSQPGRDCRGRYIEPKKSEENIAFDFKIDEETIFLVEDDQSIKYYAKENGYIAFENNTYIIKSEADVNQVSFKTTGSITVGTDSDVNLIVTENDAIKDAVGTGMEIEVTEIDIEGNVGDEAKIKAIKATVEGLTHKTSLIEADEIDINVHKGTAKGKNIKITRLEHGIVQGENVYIAQAIGGKIYAENVVIDICASYVRVKASHKIEIKKMRGSENTFTIDPLQRRKTKENYENNKGKVEELTAEMKKLKKTIESYTHVVKKNLLLFNDIKKRLMQYKKNGIKLPEAYVKQYKIYQAQMDKLKSLKEELKRVEEKLHLLTSQTDSLQYSIFDARVINRDKWIGYNEIKAKLIDPSLELVYKPQEYETNHVYGVVEVEDGKYEIRPVKEEGDV